ncbi:hypothetical protein M0804_006695 [Polistes exclamans]|nr:hypothetical protein M0804_006695 [Polistes exclamans]
MHSVYCFRYSLRSYFCHLGDPSVRVEEEDEEEEFVSNGVEDGPMINLSLGISASCGALDLAIDILNVTQEYVEQMSGVTIAFRNFDLKKGTQLLPNSS